MIRLIRIELVKLGTVRLSYGLLATAVLLTGVFSVIEAARARPGGTVAPLDTQAGLTTIVTGGVWGLLFAAVLGVTISSGEFRHQTATLTYLATPARTRVLIAKAVAAALAGTVFGLAGYAMAAVIGVFVWAIIVESVIGGLFTSVRPYLPYTAATTLAGTKLGYAGFGPSHAVSGGSPLPFAAATALLAGLAVVLAAAAAWTTVRRDIT